MKKPYVIAEMGVNFYDTARVLGITPLDAAKLYIDKAAEAGIDCAKFQSYKSGIRLYQRILQPIGIQRKSLRKLSMSCS